MTKLEAQVKLDLISAVLRLQRIQGEAWSARHAIDGSVPYTIIKVSSELVRLIEDLKKIIEEV